VFGVGTTVGNGIQGWAPGAIFVHTDGTEYTLVYRNVGSKTAATWEVLGEDSAEVYFNDAYSDFGQTTVFGCLGLLGRHHTSDKHEYLIPLNSWRTATNFAVGNLAAHAGILASDSTPALGPINGATDGCQRITWAAGDQTQIVTNVAVTDRMDVSGDNGIRMYTRIASEATEPDAVGFTVDMFFDEGDTKVSNATTTNNTSTYLNKFADVDGSDVAGNPASITIGLTPVAHANDAMYLTSTWISYSGVIMTHL